MLAASSYRESVCSLITNTLQSVPLCMCGRLGVFVTCICMVGSWSKSDGGVTAMSGHTQMSTAVSGAIPHLGAACSSCYVLQSGTRPCGTASARLFWYRLCQADKPVVRIYSSISGVLLSASNGSFRCRVLVWLSQARKGWACCWPGSMLVVCPFGVTVQLLTIELQPCNTLQSAE